jgi:tripeptidyl-peptidase-1
MFNPHPLHKTPLSKAYWCQPAISFHKSDPIAARELWDWEQKLRQERGPDQQQRPILYRDIVDFFDFASTPVRNDWNNVELDAFDAPTEEAHKSFDSCKEACQNHPKCFQFTHYRKQCRMSIIINFGIPAPPSKSDMTESVHSVAGWDVDKIQKFKTNHDCSEVEWPEPSIERIY